MDFPKFSAKISMSFDAPREISPHSVSPHHWGLSRWNRQIKQKAQKTEMGINLSHDADCNLVSHIFYGVFLEFSSHFFWEGCEGKLVFTNARRFVTIEGPCSAQHLPCITDSEMLSWHHLFGIFLPVYEFHSHCSLPPGGWTDLVSKTVQGQGCCWGTVGPFSALGPINSDLKIFPLWL
jgi:hypothetical protein